MIAQILYFCNLHHKKGHFNLHILHYCLKTCEVVIALLNPKNALHARTSQVSKKWVRTRTSQLVTALRNSQLAIAHRKSCLGYVPLKVVKLLSFKLQISDMYFNGKIVPCIDYFWTSLNYFFYLCLG